MAESILQVELIPREQQTDEVSQSLEMPSSPEAINVNAPSNVSGAIGGIAKMGSYATIIGVILKLAKDSYVKIRKLEMDQRSINEALRNYGGAGYSANSFGDRYDIFGRKSPGQSVAYKREF